MSSQTEGEKRITTRDFASARESDRKLVVVATYDTLFARLAEEGGVDAVLVGDSLGMVMQGRETTLPVTMDEIIYHTRCVTAARRYSLVMADMPFMSYATVEQALHNAARLMKEGGAQMVKLEGTADQAEIVSRLSRAGIPVCAHIGLQPQLVHKLGGYKVQGKDDAAAEAMLNDAKVLEAAGADVMVVECVPAELGKRLAEELTIPVIGIGAGPHCDGQVLVIQDMLGITPGKRPKFSRNFMEGQTSVQAAVRAYVDAVKSVSFPTEEHAF